MGFHHGSFQILPPTWALPRITCNQLIFNWCVGNKRENIPPLELLSEFHVAHLGIQGKWSSGKVNLIQMRCLMATLDKYAKKENLYLSNKDL